MCVARRQSELVALFMKSRWVGWAPVFMPLSVCSESGTLRLSEGTSAQRLQGLLLHAVFPHLPILSLLSVTLRYSPLLSATLRYSPLLSVTLRYSLLVSATLRYSPFPPHSPLLPFPYYLSSLLPSYDTFFLSL